MRVLVTLNSLELGGTQLNALDFASQARRYGVQSLLVGFSSTSPAEGPSLVDIARQRSIDLEVTDAPVTLAQSTASLRRVADDFGPDLVHAYGGWEVRAPFWGPCRFGSRPLVMTVYEMQVPYRVFDRPHLVVGTKYLEEEQRPVRSGPVHLISPPVDLALDTPGVDHEEFLASFDLDPELVRIVIVSRLADFKTLSISEAIWAMESLDRPDTQLVIVGGGPDEEALVAIGDAVNQRMRRRAVVFTGPMADPRAAYSSADVVLGMGGSAARGLAFGKPLIVTGELGWFRTFDRETESALFRNSFWSDQVDPDHKRSLIRQLRRLIDDSQLRTELGDFGRQFAEGNFGLDPMTRRLAGVYNDALEDHRRADWFLDLGKEVNPALGRLRKELRLSRLPRIGKA